MNELINIYNSGKDVVVTDSIPYELHDSIKKFMFGQAYYLTDDKMTIYAHDYRKWFVENQDEIKQIVRDIKINKIIK